MSAVSVGRLFRASTLRDSCVKEMAKVNETALATVTTGLSWPQVLEAGMLICFGISWPLAIVKMLKSRRTEGKSLPFTLLVLLGYVLGITAKVAYALIHETEVPSVTWLYAVNSFTVGVDALLYLYYHRHPGGNIWQKAGLAFEDRR